MKSNTFLIIALLIMATMSCKDQGSEVSPVWSTIRVPVRTLYEPGMVEVKFVKSVSKSDAHEFIQGFNLVLTIFTDANDSTHVGLVRVPIGEEQVWIDSLKSFPSIVEGASLVPMIFVQ